MMTIGAPEDRKALSALGFKAFMESAMYGGLGSLSDDQVYQLAGFATLDPDGPAALMGDGVPSREELSGRIVETCFSQRFSGLTERLRASTANAAAERESRARSAAFDRTGVSDDEAAGLVYSSLAGDRSKLDTLITESYFI